MRTSPTRSWDPRPQPRRYVPAGERAAKAGATEIHTVVVQGKPAETLQRLVADRSADLLVVGNRGLNTLAGRILGSVPLAVARHTPSDVLIVHTT